VVKAYLKIVVGKQCIVYWCHELQPKEKVVPQVIEKILLQDKRCSVIGQCDTDITFWDERLWTFSSKSFVAHGNSLCDHTPQNHPVWITSEEKNQNHSQYAIVTGLLGERYAPSFEFSSWVWILQPEEQAAYAQACDWRHSTSWEASWIWTYANKKWEKTLWT
jgi:DNA polymerase IIIc chi subunit